MSLCWLGVAELTSIILLKNVQRPNEGKELLLHAPVGKPGYPVASVERGKKVLVGAGKVFEVGDNDFTRCSLTPSVALLITFLI